MSLVLCDVDDVVADLLTEWVHRYNCDWDDQLVKSDFTDWDCTKTVKPECGVRFYDYLKQPNIYDTVDPIDGAVAAIERLRAHQHRVVFVTSAGEDWETMRASAGAKFRWLQRHGLLPNGRAAAKDFVVAADKALVAGDALIDDRLDTVSRYQWGRSVLFGQAHNDPAHGHDIPTHVTRCDGWSQVLELFT